MGLELGGVCDGWVLSGGVSQMMRDGHTAAAYSIQNE